MTFFVLQTFVLMPSTELMSSTEINQQNINKLDPAIHKFTKSDLPYCNIKQIKHFVWYSSWRFVRTNIYPDTWTSWWYNGWLVASWCWRPCRCLQVEAAQPFNLHKTEGLIRRQTKQAPLVQPVCDRSGSVQWLSPLHSLVFLQCKEIFCHFRSSLVNLGCFYLISTIITT